MEIAKTFFSPKGIVIFGFFIFYMSYIGLNSIYFLQRWEFHHSEHQKTLVYYQQSVCQDSVVKSATEGKNKCDEYAVFLKTDPWVRSLLDVFESNFVCSGGACSRWFNILVIALFGFAAVIFYFLIFHTSWTLSTIQDARTSLPTSYVKTKTI